MAAPPITERHKPHFHRKAPWLEPVRVATTANITIATALNNADTLDGITLATDDRVLVKDQSTASQNGIYTVSASPARDYDLSTDDPNFGFLVYVKQGTANGGKVFKNTNTSAPTVGSTSLTFTEFGGSSGSGTVTTVEEVDGSPTDSAVTTIKFPNGTLSIASHVATYTPAASSGGTDRALVDPTGLSWSWINQGSATITTYGASLELHDPASASDSWKMRIKSVPSKPYSVIAHFKPGWISDTSGVAIGWLQTSDNHFAGIGEYSSAGMHVNSFKSGTNYSITANYLDVSNSSHGPWTWMAISDDSSNRRVWVSMNGHDWILFHSVATNDFITPDRLMFGVESRNATYDAQMILDSWEETASSTP